MSRFSTANAWKWLTRSGPEQSTFFAPCELLIAFELIHQSDFDGWEWRDPGLWRHRSVTCAQIQLARRTGFSEKTVFRNLKTLRTKNDRPFWVISHGLKLGAGERLELFLRPTEVCTNQTHSPNSAVTMSVQDSHSDEHVNTTNQINSPNTIDDAEVRKLVYESIDEHCEQFNERQKNYGSSVELQTSSIKLGCRSVDLELWTLARNAFQEAYVNGVNNPKYRIKNPTGFMLQQIRDMM